MVAQKEIEKIRALTKKLKGNPYKAPPPGIKEIKIIIDNIKSYKNGI